MLGKRELSPRRAIEAIRAALEVGGLVPTRHSIESMALRRLDMNDVHNAIQKGHVQNVELGKYGEYEYRVVGPPVDESSTKDLAAIIGIKTYEKSVLITCFSVESYDRPKRFAPKAQEMIPATDRQKN